MEPATSKLRSARELWPLVALCVILCTRWMLADAWPDTVSTLSSEACAALLAAVVWFVLARRRRPPGASRVNAAMVASASLAGALLFAGTHPGLLLPSVTLKSSDQMVSFSLTPIVIAVALVAAGETAGGLNGSDLLPGIAASTGLLLILPQPQFTSYASVAVLLLTPVCVGLSAVWLGGVRGEVPRPVVAGAACVGAAVVYGLLSLEPPRAAPTFAATALDLAVVVLTLLALGKAGARRFGAQFAAVPLVLLLEGLLFTRILPDWRQTGGLVLLLIAAALLFRTQRSLGEEPGLHLLN